jgi:hypothetical protein
VLAAIAVLLRLYPFKPDQGNACEGRKYNFGALRPDVQPILLMYDKAIDSSFVLYFIGQWHFWAETL